MRLAVFSGKDMNGQRLAKQALNVGYDVTLLARSPEKVTIRHERLTVIWGDIREEAAIERTLQNADAAIGMLDGVGADGVMVTEIIAHHMRQLGLQRLLLTLDKESERAEKQKNKSLWQRIGTLLFVSEPETVSEVLTRSQLDWTILRDIAPRDVAAEKMDVFVYGHSSRVGARDFMLAQVTNTTYLGKSVGLVV